MDQIAAEIAIPTGDAPMAPSSTDAALISSDNAEAGLWLWQGEAPPQPLPPSPKSRFENILARMIPAARRAGWIALPGSLALMLLAVAVMRSAPPHGPESANAPAVAPASIPSPAVAGRIADAPPPAPASTVARPIVVVPPAPAQLTEAPVDQAQAPSAQILGREPERQMVQLHSQRKSPRIVRKVHASPVRRGPQILFPGVLTPPVMTWHGGGY